MLVGVLSFFLFFLLKSCVGCRRQKQPTHTNQVLVMKYYIMQSLPKPGQAPTATGFEIVKVHPEDDASFQTDYGRRVVAEADDLAEALQAFGRYQAAQWEQ
jgi:hypothetical protein